MTKDVRKEQITLLRFEKELAGLAALVAAGAGTVAAANNKLGSDTAKQAYAEIQSALINLADVTSVAHQNLEETVEAVGLKALEVAGGVPKGDPSLVIRSILGL